jgi:hypothetical protein
LSYRFCCTMRIARIGWVLLASWSLPASLIAQKWLEEFRPDPRCAGIVSLSAVEAGEAEATGGLVVRGIRLGTRETLNGTWVLIARAGDATGAYSLGSSGAPDSSGRHRFLRLPVGSVVVTISALGSNPNRQTLQVRSNAIDTVAIPIREAYKNDIRCSPPRFRRTGESACVTEPNEVEGTLLLAQGLVDQGERTRPGLGPFSLAQISLVRDEATCDRAGRGYGGGKGPPRRVIVIRLGNAGYVVYDPFEPEIAGEFATTMVFDRRWRILIRYES